MSCIQSLYPIRYRRFALVLGALCVVQLTSCSRRDPDHRARSGNTEAGALGNGLCDAPARVDTLPPVLSEASGVASSRAHDGVLWVNNDGNNPLTVFALDTLAHVVGHVRVLSDIANMDWEDIAISQCNGGDCIYLADIGDNYTNRTTVRLLRFPEPDPRVDTTAIPTIFPMRYPDGPHDAEALFVLPGERVFIITKGRSGPVALYGYPGPIRSDTVTLVHVRDLTPGMVQFPNMVTGASASPDGSWVAVRTYAFLQLYTPVSGDVRVLGDSLPLASLHEFQGEGVAVGGDDRVFLLGEKGFDTVPPPLSRLVCRTGQ